jgi:LPXTG-site transpeptidase (sortase) family protein
MLSSVAKNSSLSLKSSLSLSRLGSWMTQIGVVFLVVSLTTLLAIYFPVIKEESKYFFKNTFWADQKTVVALEPIHQAGKANVEQNQTTITPVDKEFGIVIPKIGANAPVVNQVDPFNPQEYQAKLAQGVAHAKGSAHPGSLGNTFLFAHSSASFLEASRYNAVFYLLNKLEKDDLIYITYQNRIYEYRVSETKIVPQEAVEYLSENHTQKTLTLMTCWPAGTTLKRLLVRGELVEE